MKIETKESEKVEFKKSLAQLDDGLKAVCAFLNHKGGTVYFGINDKGELVGTEVSAASLKEISQKVRQQIRQEVTVGVREVRAKGKPVIKVSVPEGTNKLYFYKGIAYKRVGAESIPIPPDELKRIYLAMKPPFDELICKDATLKDIDEEKVWSFLRTAKYERRLDIKLKMPIREALHKLELMKGNKLTNAAILLFGKNPQRFFYQSEVRCARFKGTEPITFIDMKVLGGSILDQVEDALEFVKKHIMLHVKIEEKPQRIETWEYPIDAIREAITNAICHRDYEIASNVQVRIFDDRIEVLGCGPLPGGQNVEDLKKTHKSILRNPLVGKCFFLIKYIEEWGTGTNRIVEECIKVGLPEPLFEMIAGGLVVTIRKYRITEEILRELNERQRKAVEYLKERKKITSKEYLELNPEISERTALYDLKELVRKGLIEEKGIKKSRYYILK